MITRYRLPPWENPKESKCPAHLFRPGRHLHRVAVSKYHTCRTMNAQNRYLPESISDHSIGRTY